MKRVATAFAVLATVILISVPDASGRPASGRSVPGPDQRLDRAIRAWQTAGVPATPIVLRNFKLLGHNDLQGFRDFGDVFARGQEAYVGTRCGKHLAGGRGVKVLDVSDPTDPTIISTLKSDLGTRAEDVVIRDVSTPTFTGALAAVGIQQCFGSPYAASTGIKFFDVTDPADPQLLGEYLFRPGGVGCHEIDLVQRPDGRVLAGCARNLVDQFHGHNGVFIFDVTDPTDPIVTTRWSLGVDLLDGVGCFEFNFAHSVRFEAQGSQLYVSNWDAGTVLLDVTDPSSPQEITTTDITPPDEDGDQHSMTLANNGRWLIINPEDDSPLSCPGDPRWGGFGEAWVYDATDPANPSLLGSFSTPNSRSTRTDGDFDIHNTEVVRIAQMFSSWYSDGVVWWTMSSKGASRELGQFVPPGERGVPPLVWGVAPMDDGQVILASDITTGLWVVSPTGLEG
jgi:hypothetical protein